MLYVDMFSAAVINCIDRVIDCALIIDIENSGSEIRDAEFGSEGSQPDYLPGCEAFGHVFGFH